MGDLLLRLDGEIMFGGRVPPLGQPQMQFTQPGRYGAMPRTGPWRIEVLFGLDACGIGLQTSRVAQVELTRHLKEYFPQLAATPLSLQATTVAELVRAIDAGAPGFAFYVCDELGRLRQHVNVFVDEEMIVDRQRLTDHLDTESRVFIAQALSGG